MNKSFITIGNAAAFWGDSPKAAFNLVSQYPALDFLTMDYLSEVSMSIMAIQREKDLKLGYAKDFIDVVQSLIPLWKNGAKVKLISNAGGLNPLGLAVAIRQILQDEFFKNWKIAVVEGDDVLSKLTEEESINLETHESYNLIKNHLVTANAYLGAAPIAKCLKEGAHIVITGRVADPSLTVAPCVASFNWSDNDYDKLAQSTVAGHLIECGTQVTGGFSTNWLDIENPENIGFPIVEVYEDGTFVITKPLDSSGKVDRQTVTEQLLYEIGDPNNYISPDVTVSFTSLTLEDAGENRILVANAKGKKATDKYKVSATYKNGFRLDAFLTFFGQNAVLKAKKSAETIFAKVKKQGINLEETWFECLGALDAVPGVFNRNENSLECVLRIAAKDSNKKYLEVLAKEIAPMITSGPQGVTGYTTGRPQIREVFGYWPTLIAKDKVNPKISWS